MDESSFVFLHLGSKKFPNFLYDNIEQARLLNPNSPIYLGISIFCSNVDRQRLKNVGVKIAHINFLKKSSSHRVYKSRLTSKNFWRFTSERFFVLEELIRKFNLVNVVHLENDVMVYVSLSDLINKLKKNFGEGELGLTRDGPRRCIGGFVFVPEISAIQKYNEFLLMIKGTNDMESLSQYGYFKSLKYLPVVSNTYSENDELSNRIDQVMENSSLSDLFDTFGGIFDAAALGQYVGGIDKIHNANDTRGFINESACYNPSKMGLHWKRINGLWAPFARDSKGGSFPVFNLHLHCKTLSKFRSDNPNLPKNVHQECFE